jgi:hypothetical protein
MKIAHLARNILLAALLVSSAVFARPGIAATKPDMQSALTTWKQTVESGKLKNIMKLYDKDAIMISTFAQAPLTKRSEIEDYFKLVVVNEGVRVDILESHPREFGDMAVNSGRYELSYTQEGEEINIPARFTFVYRLEHGEWIIVDQHSSRMPDTKEKK